MSPSRRNRQNRPPRPPRASEFWKTGPEPAEPAPVEVARDPTALLRSLGPPPLPGQGAVAEHYLAAVAQRAAGLATAVVAAASLLADSGEEDA